MSTFNQDLEQGIEVEEAVLLKLQGKYPDAYRDEGYKKEWDIFIPSLNKAVEVKQDLESQNTGNILIEISFGGKPSALSTTKAAWWIFDIGHDHYIVTTPERIWNVIDVNGFQPIELTGRGDDTSKMAYLIKKNIIFADIVGTIPKL